MAFDWQPGRGAKYLQQFVPEDFEGTMQCDGYSAYPAFAKFRGEGITLAGCMAHARRKFREAFDLKADSGGAWILKKIGELYRIERQLRDARAGPDERRRARLREAKPIFGALFEHLHHLKITKAHLPKGTMGKAIDYALGQRRALEVYLGDGRVEIDNNLCENAIRPTALGKKNWLFVGAEGAGWRSAVIYSVIEPPPTPTDRRSGRRGQKSNSLAIIPQLQDPQVRQRRNYYGRRPHEWRTRAVIGLLRTHQRQQQCGHPGFCQFHAGASF